MASVGETSYPDGVYPPSDDTFLLVDALDFDTAAAAAAAGGGGGGVETKRKAPSRKSKEVVNVLPLDVTKVDTILEIGCGSGFVSTSASILVPNAYVLGTDLSSRACLASKATLEAHKRSGRADVVASESLCCIKATQGFDLILINPPYVPTSSEELLESLQVLRTKQMSLLGCAAACDVETENAAFTLTWAGGNDGVEMTKVMLRAGLSRLSVRDGSRLYLIVVQENQPEEIGEYGTSIWDDVSCREHGSGKGGNTPSLSWSIALQTRANNELLSVLRFVVGFVDKIV